MKKNISILLVAIMMLCGLTACGSTDGQASAKGKLKIVTTIFPIYDWTMNVLGDKASEAEVTMLLDNGVDLHSFQPTALDIMQISSCDLFIYVGGESDEWVEDALKESVNKDMVVINLLDALGDKVKEEEVVEGMQEGEHHHDDDDEDHDHEHEEGPEYDEHVWLSLKNASVLTEKIGEALKSIDKANAEKYDANVKAYTGKLASLDAQYTDAVAAGKTGTLLFGDRFPFRYMTDDYGLKYYAAFVGCSAETEASFETVTFLASKVDELGLKAVLTIESSDGKIANTIVSNTAAKDQKVLMLDSMQSVTGKDVKNGTTYLSVMEGNLEVLKEALK